MSIAFIANVGSRDILVSGVANLPKDSRTLGEVILENWDTYKVSLRLPILLKALESVVQKHGEASHIILFASDQKDANFRHTDTEPFARIVVKSLIEKYGNWVRDAVEIVTIDNNPSDYDSMMLLYEQKLKVLKKGFDNVEKVYIAVTGGTPAMSFMLLWQGVGLFEQRAEPLYVLQDRSIPITLNIGQTLLVKAIISDIRESLKVYQYDAVLSLIKSKQDSLKESWAVRYNAIESLVNYARQRYNFNFELAQSALLGGDRGLSTPLKQKVDSIVRDIADRDEAWILREELYGLQIDFSSGAYKDGITNIFAFNESFLRQYALKSGVPIINDFKNLDPSWLETQPELVAYLEEKKVRYTEVINTYVLKMILAFFGKTDGNIKSIVKRFEGFNNLQDLRNKAIHLHKGISVEDVAQAYSGGERAVQEELWSLYEVLYGKPPVNNPYEQVNELILELIEWEE